MVSTAAMAATPSTALTQSEVSNYTFFGARASNEVVTARQTWILRGGNHRYPERQRRSSTAQGSGQHQDFLLSRSPTIVARLNLRSARGLGQGLVLQGRGRGAGRRCRKDKQVLISANVAVSEIAETAKEPPVVNEIRKAAAQSLSEASEEDQNAVVQFESELLQEALWKRQVAKAQGKLKGSQWDPLPGPPMDFSTFWKYVQDKQVKYMEYGEHGKLISVILPHPADELGYKVTVDAPKDTPDLEMYENMVWQRHQVLQMPADATTELWAELRGQVVDIKQTYPLSVWAQTQPTLNLFFTWFLRLFFAVVVFRALDAVLYPMYKGRRPDEIPKRRKKNLMAAMESDLGLFGQSRARFVSAEETTGVTFDDFAGQEYVKRELQEVVKILKDAKEYTDLGVTCPKGVMLHGPPGTGKTLLAKAIAGEAGVPFFSVSGAEFVEMFVGVAAARVRDLFARARAFAPSIIFIDEIDAIGASRGSRGGDDGGGSVEREQGLIQILTELDGFQINDARVLVIGATNRLDMLDSALLRKGRFDRVVAVGKPTPPARLEILKVHARNKTFNSEEEKASLLQEVADITDDYSGAELANVVNEAAILAVRKDKDTIERDELMEAIKRQLGEFKTGQEDVVDLSGEVRMRMAYREAAVAVLSCRYPQPGMPMVKTNAVDIDSTINMEYQTTRRRKYARKPDYVNSIVRLCAPSVVEDMVYGAEMTSWGSEKSGVAVAAQVAELLILRSGQTAFGPAYYETANDLMRHLRPKLVALRDEYLRFGVQQCQAVLLQHQVALEALADLLMEKDEVYAEEIWHIYNTSPQLPAPFVRQVDEYGALIHVGRWGLPGAALPGRATFHPGNIGFATFGAPRPDQVQLGNERINKEVMANIIKEQKQKVENRRRAKEDKVVDLLLPLEQLV